VCTDFFFVNIVINFLTTLINIPTTSSPSSDYNLDFFSLPTSPSVTYYLAEAKFTNTSNIRKWSGTDFNTYYQNNFPKYNNYVIEHFVINNTYYLAFNNYMNQNASNSFIASIDIYRWNPILPSNNFVLIQSLPSNGGRSSTFFQIGSSYYLAVAESGDTVNTNIDSTIWQFNPSSGMFQQYQLLPTRGAWDWYHFTIAGNDFLALSNFHANPEGYNVLSNIYIWNGLEFSLLANVVTFGATSLRTFTNNGINYIFVTNSNNQQGSTLNSVLYRLTPL